MLGGDEEKDPDAAKKEEERQEALRQEEEERKAKYAKMEAEREAMRQGIRDKVGGAGAGGGPPGRGHLRGGASPPPLPPRTAPGRWADSRGRGAGWVGSPLLSLGVRAAPGGPESFRALAARTGSHPHGWGPPGSLNRAVGSAGEGSLCRPPSARRRGPRQGGRGQGG